MERCRMQSGFLDRLITRLDKLDPKSLQAQFLHLARERGLLETIFQSIQEGVMVVDGNGRLSYANRAAEHLLGFEVESSRGRPVQRYLREMDWDRLTEMDEGEWSKLISREIEISYPEHRFLSVYAVPLPSALETASGGVLVILRDITRDREHEATLLESERLHAVKLLAAGVAHEIGNPLNALGIHLQLLEREVKAMPESAAPALLELVDVARNEVSRLDMIITQFLRAIRPSKPQFAPEAVTEILEDTLRLLKTEIENRSIRVEIERPETVPTLPMDRHQIKQVFFNIIKNALQAMPDGGTLSIRVEVGDVYLSLAFRDTGVGIRREDFGRVFEPYHTTKPDGSGLGLMIVQRIIQEHGGQIELSSKVEEGTCFAILLPLIERRMRMLKTQSPAAAASDEKG